MAESLLASPYNWIKGSLEDVITDSEEYFSNKSGNAFWCGFVI